MRNPGEIGEILVIRISVLVFCSHFVGKAHSLKRRRKKEMRKEFLGGFGVFLYVYGL